MKKHCALVLGGYVNGYSIIQELHEKGIKEIILFDYSRNIATFSNKIKKYEIIKKDPVDLLKKIKTLHKEYEYIVVYPTDDLQLELLYKIHNEIANFCFLPYNYDNLLDCLDKYFQYQVCEKLNIPYPKTIILDKVDDFKNIKNIMFPIIIKPRKRDDLNTGIFRNLIISNENELFKYEGEIKDFLNKGFSFLVSEVIPGEADDNIYAYVAYRNKKGEILNEWVGKKISQYPDDYGVFSSVANEAPEIIREQGRKLLEGMNLQGICEPEFKYDYRDKKYKLMEVNLRSTMWHRLGNLTGVNLQYTQYLDALGEADVKRQQQDLSKRIHFCYLNHEVMNLFFRKKYFKKFIRNIFKSDKTYFAFYDLKDIRPFLVSLFRLFKSLVIKCLKQLKTD